MSHSVSKELMIVYQLLFITLAFEGSRYQAEVGIPSALPD